ncbi:MAG: hypothetical protein KJ799_18170 [Bacteroidetes bacterium]|nr:hypothetical protein [Bacteroidota bacterium]MBU1678905.1 hypothetical protein [Bacteroidota bacterium]MBU2508626.1 hypothetical protein [Bacteroidota bacterium]
MKTKNINEIILKSLDSELSEEEKRFLDEEIQKHPELQSERDWHMKLRGEISTLSSAEFSSDFELKVMNRIRTTKHEERESGNLFLQLALPFKRVVLPAMIVLIILLTYNLTITESVSAESLIGMSTVPMEDLFDPGTTLILE